MSQAGPSISIFGSTGGSGLNILRLCLRASFQCTVLCRTPAKVLALLKLESAPPNLRIITGDIRDQAAVSSTLSTPTGNLSDVVISTIGMPPPEGFSLKVMMNPFKDADLHICRDGVQSIVTALSTLRAEGKTTANANKNGPLLISYSTTGISDAGRDLPLLMVPVYKLIETPHIDKKEMEKLLERSTDLRWIIIRPSLLTGDGQVELAADDKPAANGKKIRVGIERNGKFEKKEIGTAITRAACAEWVYREVIRKLDEAKKYEKAMVSLTF